MSASDAMGSQFSAVHFADHRNSIDYTTGAIHPQIDGWLHASLLTDSLARQHGVPPVDVKWDAHPAQGSNFSVYRPKIDKRNAAIYIPRYDANIDKIISHEFTHHLDAVKNGSVPGYTDHTPDFYKRVADVHANLPKRWRG